jgi:YVTN family beta-propeller protein
MKSKIKSTPVVLLAALMLLVSCQSKDVIKGKYQSGVLVANEGGFGSSNGDVTFYNNSSSSLQQAIFKAVNGSFPGDVLESVTVSGDAGYLVLNGSNKIEVIDNNTFQRTATWTDVRLISPRYIQIINGKAYVSVWGSYDANFSLIDSYVLVFDPKTSAVVAGIDTDEGTENLLFNGQYLFASNYNFGSSNTVNVIDPTTNKSIEKITLYAGPGGMVTDANNKLWVIAQGTYAGNDGKLFKINPTTFVIEQTIELGLNPSNPDLAISPDKKSLYYYSGSSVYKIEINATTAPASSWVSNADIVSLYSMGVDPRTGDVYLGDALNYSSEGKVYVYGSNANLKTTFSAGINPGQFIFK